MSSSPRFRLLALGAIVSAAALTVSACSASSSGSESPASNGAAADSGTPVAGGTLRFGILDAPQHLDPEEGTSYPESIIGDNITDRLIWQDPATGKLTPWLATSWTYNKALTEYTFHLRQGVTFSDGTAFDAQSVKDNYDQRAFGSAKLGIAADTTHWSGYVSTKVADPETVVITFAKPNAVFLQTTSFSANNPSGFLAESTLKETAQQRAANAASIIGTGPFVITSFKYQQNVVLTRRQGYTWAPAAIAHQDNAGAAYLNEVDIQTIPEASVRTGSLQSGDLDASLDVQPTDETALKEAGFQILAQGVPGKNIGFDLNTGLFPTDDLAVRKALTIGWDRSSLTKSVLTSSYKVATSVLGSRVPGYVDYSSSALRYDQAGAEKLLQDDGWVAGPDGIRVKDGKRLTVKFIGINNLVVNQPAYELIQAELKKIGIDVQLSVLPIPDYVAQQAKAKTTYNGVAANTSRDDPAVLWQQYSPLVANSANIAAGSPAATELTAALQKIQDTLDPAERATAAKAAQDLVLTKYALADPVYEPTQVVAAAAKTHGIGFDAQSRNYFYNAWLGK
jgi:peptide/nickel transport system substrate-binding protein